MRPSNAPEASQFPSSSSDQPLLTSSFPTKLRKLADECKSGAITWSADGTGVAIDHTNSRWDYLDSRLNIFKTTSIASFARQLNLYGFQKVSPDLHVFRNDSFDKDRPDILLAVACKMAASPGPPRGNHSRALGTSAVRVCYESAKGACHCGYGR
ncbi:hypothetical protein HPB48_015218 [Haemaphysalis longicornis]|uniref:HSF-type DNA-binding domain-containing protein n=1 Tax=Haemaphysalis longicornis TaxID=44386 RepID=A0A9J6FIQ2_HAELO|nr:hypothetical protein HPB48_015218 [Haemaphysalis longicornis]